MRRNPVDGRKLLRGGTIQCRIAPTDAVGDGSAIVAPAPATATSSRNNSANSRPSSVRSGLIKNVHRPERGCPTIGPSGTPPLRKCALTACPSRAGIVIAHTDPPAARSARVPAGRSRRADHTPADRTDTAIVECRHTFPSVTPTLIRRRLSCARLGRATRNGPAITSLASGLLSSASHRPLPGAT